MGSTQILLVLIVNFCNFASFEKNADNTDLVKGSNDRPLLFTTLGGGIIAIEQNSGNIVWTLNDEPVVKIPNENFHFDPQFLPDPRYGNLYVFGTHGGEKQILKKLPFSIPQLVTNAPCRSSDGILYTGKKIDTWFMIDPKTGIRKQILGYENNNLDESVHMNICPIDPKNAVFVARTEYNILMYDSKKDDKKWNITYFDYSSHTMGGEMLKEYDIVHFTSTSNGRLTSFDRKSGQLLWSHNMPSPVVAAYLLDREGLITIPFNIVGEDTMDHIIENFSTLQNEQDFKQSDIELFPSLYIGEHVYGLYALPSLVDKHTITISSDNSQPLLIEGPNEKSEHDDIMTKEKISTFRPNVNIHYNMKTISEDRFSTNYFLLGHYSIPKYAETNFKKLSKLTSLSMPVNFIKTNIFENTHLKLIVADSETEKHNRYEVSNASEIQLQINVNNQSELLSVNEYSNSSKHTVSVQTDFNNEINNYENISYIHNISLWIMQKSTIYFNIIFAIIIIVIFIMICYLRNQIITFQQLSQSGLRNSRSFNEYNNGQNFSFPEELSNGFIKVGKIIFHPNQIIGKGCDGTFVYRGVFENRDVAVKRLLPECFSFADREVALLSESDTHANVVRYYCMEQDKLFRYIALELCSTTLHDYVYKGLETEYQIRYLEILKQATEGLAHLHSLNIVHRDIKPHNVLLTITGGKNCVRAMISDFGLCKKLNIGRNSFSHRSGITGTDGWIAPELLKGDRTTTSVDIFSLGCVYYFVLSKGLHPFGDVLERQAKILKGDCDLKYLSSVIAAEELDLALCLITAMLSSNPQSRPEASLIIKYPLFWDKQKILSFFQDVSDRLERDPPGGPLEHGATVIICGDWRGKVCDSVAADLRKYRSYSGDSIKDLLRAMRNKKHHYRELTLEAQTSLGTIPENFTLYWLKRFPKLLLHTWLQMQYYKTEIPINMYYSENYEFNSNFILEQYKSEGLENYNCTTFNENNLFTKSRHYYDYKLGKKTKSRHVLNKLKNTENSHVNSVIKDEVNTTNTNVSLAICDVKAKVRKYKSNKLSNNDKSHRYGYENNLLVKK